MKLNRTQIEAIADKAVRDLRAALETKKEELRKAYTPSEEYIRVQKLVDKLEALNEQQNELEKEFRGIFDSLNLPLWSSKSSILDEIRDKDLHISTPNFSGIKEDIKTDLTINTIDSSFDPHKFIEETVNNYLNS